MTAAKVVVQGVGLEVARWQGAGGALPILMLHEGLGSVSLWRDFPARLAEASGREVIAWSRRGHGSSDPIEGRRAPDYMHREADALPALMDMLGIRRAHFFGHSDGGSIALIVASKFPFLVESLVLEAPHVLVERCTVDSIGAIGAAYDSSDLPRRLARHHSDPDHIFRAWNAIWLDPRFRDWNIEALLTGIKAPTLAIQGVDDEYGTLHQLDLIEAAVAGTERLVLDACGHSPHRDALQAVLAATASFLKGKV